MREEGEAGPHLANEIPSKDLPLNGSHKKASPQVCRVLVCFGLAKMLSKRLLRSLVQYLLYRLLLQAILTIQ